MTAGRLVGDAVNARIGPLLLVRGGAVVAIVPLLVMLAVGSPALALVCLVLVGLGLANGVPLLFSAAGRRAGGSPGHDIAAVSSLGSLGFVIGPPLIGGIAHGTSLPWALACLALAGVAVLGLARRAVG
jgi:MFS family permease